MSGWSNNDFKDSAGFAISDFTSLAHLPTDQATFSLLPVVIDHKGHLHGWLASIISKQMFSGGSFFATGYILQVSMFVLRTVTNSISQFTGFRLLRFAFFGSQGQPQIDEWSCHRAQPPTVTLCKSEKSSTVM